MSIVCGIDFSGGGLRNNAIAAGAGILANKVIQHYSVSRLLTAAEATTVTALEIPLHIVTTPTSTITHVEAVVFTAAVGNYTTNVDLKKSTGAGAFASILTGTILFDSSVAARTAQSGVLSNSSLVDGDLLKATVTVAGSSGSQAAGVLITVTLQDTLA